MVPDEDIFTVLPETSDLMRATTTESLYIKRPKISIYDLGNGTPHLANLLRHEAEMFQLISKAPHSSIDEFRMALASAVFHLHSPDLTHNDINPENIMHLIGFG